MSLVLKNIYLTYIFYLFLYISNTSHQHINKGHNLQPVTYHHQEVSGNIVCLLCLRIQRSLNQEICFMNNGKYRTFSENTGKKEQVLNRVANRIFKKIPEQVKNISRTFLHFSRTHGQIIGQN